MTDYDIMYVKMRSLGMEPKAAKMFIKRFAEDERVFPASAEEKKWAMERGFFPGRIMLYGLTEENFKNYMPDYHYYMLHLLLVIKLLKINHIYQLLYLLFYQ